MIWFSLVAGSLNISLSVYTKESCRAAVVYEQEAQPSYHFMVTYTVYILYVFVASINVCKLVYNKSTYLTHTYLSEVRN